MPKVRRRRLPPALLDHLLERADQRGISYTHLEQLYCWLACNPTVPNGRWFKRFPEFTLCGESELVKTFLLPGQHADGQEVH